MSDEAVKNIPEAIKMKGSELASLHAVGVSRSGRWLIRNIDLAVHRGEIVSLIGPNGSGKTTVARILANSLKPDTGTAKIRPDTRIGYVPQKITFDSTMPMTVYRLMNIPHRADKEEIDAALDEFNIQHLANSAVQNLSGGEFQRALFARALLRKPDFLILDEPVQGLDFEGQTKLYNRIAEIRDRLNCGILLISHDLHVVMAQTDFVVCLNGHICCTGEPQHVEKNPAYLELFGSRVMESRAIYSHFHDHSHHVDGSISKS